MEEKSSGGGGGSKVPGGGMKSTRGGEVERGGAQGTGGGEVMRRGGMEEETGGGGGTQEHRKRQEVEEEQRRKQEAWVVFLVEHADEAHHCHVEKEWLKQVGTVRKEQLWGKAREEVRGGSRVQKCGYCIRKGTACKWPLAGSKAHSCS